MKIEEKNFSGVLQSIEKSKKLLQSDLEYQTSYSQKENLKVIKLIHQKMYPLNHSQKSALIFPKLKEKYDNPLSHMGKQTKNYIEITLQQDQSNNLLIKHRTDLENEHFLNEKLSQRKCTQRLKANRDNQDQQFKNQEFQRSKKCIKSQFFEPDRCFMSEKPKDNNSLFDQSLANTTFFHNEGQRILCQSITHFTFLKKMKEGIKKQKDQYFKNANFTQIFENNNGTRKQNYSIQYLVKSIQNKSTKNGAVTSPYERQSPNKLGQFAKMFEKKKRSLMLWEELELVQPALEKQRSTGEQLKSTNQMSCKNRHKTIIEEQSEINIQNILSAKYRIKNNHKKMIQLSKTKPV